MWRFTGWHLIRCQSPYKQCQHVFDLAPSEESYLNFVQWKQYFNTIQDLFSFSSRFLHLLLPINNAELLSTIYSFSCSSLPLVKKDKWCESFLLRTLQPIFGSFCGSNSTVQYLGLGFDSMEEEPLSHCRVKLERAVWSSVMCTFNEAH